MVAQNIDRRHLNGTQRALLAKKLEPLYAAEAKERQREAAVQQGERGKEGGRGKKKPTSQKVDTRVSEKANANRAAERAAKAAKTNRQYVSDLKKMEKEAPEVYAKIEAGEIELTPAKRQVREQKREQRRQENAELVKVAKTPEEIKAKFATIVIDPPWDVSDEGDVNQFGRANPDYHTMPFADILKLPVAAKADAGLPASA